MGRKSKLKKIEEKIEKKIEELRDLSYELDKIRDKEDFSYGIIAGVYGAHHKTGETVLGVMGSYGAKTHILLALEKIKETTLDRGKINPLTGLLGIIGGDC
jgi:hypothetical protein